MAEQKTGPCLPEQLPLPLSGVVNRHFFRYVSENQHNTIKYRVNVDSRGKETSITYCRCFTKAPDILGSAVFHCLSSSFPEGPSLITLPTLLSLSLDPAPSSPAHAVLPTQPAGSVQLVSKQPFSGVRKGWAHGCSCQCCEP